MDNLEFTSEGEGEGVISQVAIWVQTVAGGTSMISKRRCPQPVDQVAKPRHFWSSGQGLGVEPPPTET